MLAAWSRTLLDPWTELGRSVKPLHVRDDYREPILGHPPTRLSSYFVITIVTVAAVGRQLRGLGMKWYEFEEARHQKQCLLMVAVEVEPSGLINRRLTLYPRQRSLLDLRVTSKSFGIEVGNDGGPLVAIRCPHGRTSRRRRPRGGRAGI